MTRRTVHRPDQSQRALVKALRDAGIRVWLIGRPCDLLLRFWCNRHHEFCWQTLECKTPQKSGKPRVRHDQPDQQEFLSSTDTPVATTFEAAWTVLNARHRLGRTDVPCVLKPLPA